MKRIMLRFLCVSSVVLFLCFGIHSMGEGKSRLAGKQPPLPEVKFNNESLNVKLGSYCWTEDSSNQGVCVDTAGVPEVLDGEFAVINKTGKIKVSFKNLSRPDNLTIVRVKEQDAKQEKLIGNVFSTPEEEGVYYYEIFARWLKEENVIAGDAYYGFIVKVE
ncbi:hypothetical protein [Pseudalkalibacillus caeni]|uniref:Uncharacterized protein n=1 Tax=Exobacillus caeni TaxID=2574798 RepID=A0A5R9F7G6_9BACL|nr:hypothetical protein [Pseudalkalibacillus caeni]TLS38276.1 hypothetical protein FCL54_07035 [Pseudalkalibacillus caeni]